MHTKSRERLPEERIGLTRKCRVGQFKYYLTVNFFEASHRPGEVFIKIAKEGSTVSGLVDALAVTLSIALQYGVPWGVLGRKYVKTIFEPRDDKHSSLVDSIASEIDLAIETQKRILEIVKESDNEH